MCYSTKEMIIRYRLSKSQPNPVDHAALLTTRICIEEDVPFATTQTRALRSRDHFLKNHSGNAQFECRRRKDRGMGCGEGRVLPLTRKNLFSILDFKWAHFRAKYFLYSSPKVG